ncbi:MAG TPA: hypothetical protein VG269_17700 [Tepidisphaeraceae bacterium]|jgi:hypothetical protein|nr:hypothetical protein [Tepidisphaeraceae bacterium]
MQNQNSISSKNMGGQATRIIRSALFLIAATVIVVKVLTAQGEAGSSGLVAVMGVLTGLVMALTGIMSLGSREMF